MGGTVIILNGTSSAGKTTIAHALQNALEEPYLYLGIDTFIDMVPERYSAFEPSDDPSVTTFVAHADSAGPWAELSVGTVETRVFRAMYSAVAALANRDLSVIFDDVITEPALLQEAVRAFGGLRVLFVGVRCPLAVLEQREHERGDRFPGIARGLLNRVHADCTYDLEVGTSQLSVEQCVERVLQALSSAGSSSAFQRLLSELPGESGGWDGT